MLFILFSVCLYGQSCTCSDLQYRSALGLVVFEKLLNGCKQQAWNQSIKIMISRTNVKKCMCISEEKQFNSILQGNESISVSVYRLHAKYYATFASLVGGGGGGGVALVSLMYSDLAQHG